MFLIQLILVFLTSLFHVNGIAVQDSFGQQNFEWNTSQTITNSDYTNLFSSNFTSNNDLATAKQQHSLAEVDDDEEEKNTFRSFRNKTAYLTSLKGELAFSQIGKFSSYHTVLEHSLKDIPKYILLQVFRL